MATSEDERVTSIPCKFCGAPLRRFGRVEFDMLLCTNPGCSDPEFVGGRGRETQFIT